jgi:hypothetical protein
LEIFGVDFSGAKSDQHTWLAQGVLDGNRLTLTGCRPTPRAELTQLLTETSGPAVAALDFPFGVPESFVRYWCPAATTMPDLWAAAADLELADFVVLRDGFVAQRGEPKRRGDAFFPECYSPLHKANPNLVPMTFYGMRMLHQLGVANFEIPPLEYYREDDPVDAEEAAPTPAKGTLLEAMPGAALRAMGLPYKGYKNGVRAPQLRQQILEGLQGQTFVSLANLEDYWELALSNHDGLDSIVAALTAALWALDPRVFRCPTPEGSDDFDPVARLEGWLYAPSFLLDGGSAIQ